jgi:hypothetical protein
VFENKELRITFGPETKEHGENYITRNFITFIFIKSIRMMKAGHVARIGKLRNAYKISSGNMKGRDYLEHSSGDLNLLAEKRVQWRALLNTTMNLRVR